MTELSWQPSDPAQVTLEALRAFVREVSADLDPSSRYVAELQATLEASRDVADYLARLEDQARVRAFQRDGSVASHGERGRSWVDEETWARMDPYERTLSNLLTGETRMMWAGDGAACFARLGEVLAAVSSSPARVLSVPCSTGKEPFSIVIAALRAGVDVRVTGVDRQAAYVARARSGALVPHPRDWDLPGVEAHLLRDGARSRVADEVLARCELAVGDVLTGDLPAGPFDLVSCRNLLGYFRGESLEAAFRHVAGRVRRGGALLLDPFVTGAAEMARVPEMLAEGGFVRRYPEACFYDLPGS